MKRNNLKSIDFRQDYRWWKLRSLEETGYFVIFQGFVEEEILKNISGNALKLYIYLGINSNNMEGIVWHSNKKIADYFNKSERTIRGWMKELEEIQLIKRMRITYDGQVYTYLRPYENKKGFRKKILSGNLYFNEDRELCFKHFYGKIKLEKDEYECSLNFREVGEVLGILKLDELYYFESYDKEIKIKLAYEVYKDKRIKAILRVE